VKNTRKRRGEGMRGEESRRGRGEQERGCGGQGVRERGREEQRG